MAGIDNIRSGQPMTTTNRSSARAESNASSRSESAPKATGKQDEVSLSQQGKAIGQLHQQMASQPSFDSAKVAAIKEAISNGSYSVDPEKLADNMMKFENEFSGLEA
ncbi:MULTISPECIES: flagellar biosynthesis anti-sigma factor FlgM [Vibrio]|uniref:Negative regulator of flagellin synthesis n=2 Tax=Vibrio TaxID=662 RepID=A0A1E5DBP2_9VIBR|nr:MULTISPECIES: flagellar biosynthesis anti-sigma factor FlgM [Vibrio]RBW67150.1 flagellar biosynthesis anti-sigma factor FlgM [Vibrionales bacterium C3R12]MDN3697816.1 flagellar biosynthesis anti-sigma factor FlgM [Vibrio cortegadensis]NOH85630.1 flagellar biosynthesis anti-sigma factor FlgM [Vibrio sp. 03-59-1]OEE81201.1 flagellar biosynthesis anti-sigma factor FlgM [Vibrio genomosp. F6 str. FF-238]TKF22683.1 flagellar biosynthesis anti-sigma factor FlgM [Vibrio genomosp. F6]